MFPSNPNPPQHTGDPQKAGFTLVEILIAFVIAVMALGALYRMASTGLATETVTSQYSRALLIAQSALESAGIETPLVPGASRRTLENGYEEELTVRSRPDLLRPEDAASAPYPYEIAVRVGWRDGRRSRSLELSTVRLGLPP